MSLGLSLDLIAHCDAGFEEGSVLSGSPDNSALFPRTLCLSIVADMFVARGAGMAGSVDAGDGALRGRRPSDVGSGLGIVMSLFKPVEIFMY